MGRDRQPPGLAKGAGTFQNLAEARRIAQPKEHSPAITDIPYRAISIYPSLLLARAGVSPNAITVAWGCLGIIAVAGLAYPSYGVRVAAAILLEVSYLLDFVDGEVARLQERTSNRGFFIDLASHGLIKAALFLFVGYRVLVVTGRMEYLVLAFSAATFVTNIHMLPYYAKDASVTDNRPRRNPGGGLSIRELIVKVLGLAGIAFESPGLYGFVLAGAIFDRWTWILMFYGVLSPFWYFYRAAKYR